MRSRCSSVSSVLTSFQVGEGFEELVGQPVRLEHLRRHAEHRLRLADAQRAAEVALAEREMRSRAAWSPAATAWPA